MLIHLDNEGEEGWVLVWADDPDEAELDKTILGSRWEFSDKDFAHTSLMDDPGLIEALKAEGYELELSMYERPKWADTLWGLIDEESGELLNW